MSSDAEPRLPDPGLEGRIAELEVELSNAREQIKIAGQEGINAGYGQGAEATQSKAISRIEELESDLAKAQELATEYAQVDKANAGMSKALAKAQHNLKEQKHVYEGLLDSAKGNTASWEEWNGLKELKGELAKAKERIAELEGAISEAQKGDGFVYESDPANYQAAWHGYRVVLKDVLAGRSNTELRSQTEPTGGP